MSYISFPPLFPPINPCLTHDFLHFVSQLSHVLSIILYSLHFRTMVTSVRRSPVIAPLSDSSTIFPTPTAIWLIACKSSACGKITRKESPKSAPSWPNNSLIRPTDRYPR